MGALQLSGILELLQRYWSRGGCTGAVAEILEPWGVLGLLQRYWSRGGCTGTAAKVLEPWWVYWRCCRGIEAVVGVLGVAMH